MHSNNTAATFKRFQDLDHEAWGIIPEVNIVNNGVSIARQLIIHPPNDESVFVNSYVRQEDVSTIEFFIRTRDDNGQRNPNFTGNNRAHILARRALEDFEDNGFQITKLTFDWMQPNPKFPISSNYDTFIKIRDRELSRGASQQDAKRIAAFSTWTGAMLARPNGFTQLHSIDDESFDQNFHVISGIMAKP